MAHLHSLSKIYNHLKDVKKYRKCSRERIGKIILGSSVIRVFVKNTKRPLLTCLGKTRFDNIKKLSSQHEYDSWHLRQTTRVYNCLRSQRGNITRIKSDEGLKFGHATKIFNLYIGHLVFYSPYFKFTTIRKVKYFLHVPLDKKVFDVLRACGVNHIPSSIKNLTKETYYHLQEEIRRTAKSYQIPPLYFDDYAWTFDEKINT